MYKVIPNFISEEEQQLLLGYVQRKVAGNSNQVRSYSDNAKKLGDALSKTSAHIYYIPIVVEAVENNFIADIVHRIQDAAGMPAQNPNTPFNWVISIAPLGTEVPEHKDPIDKSLENKKIVRMNLLVQNATRGGLFELKDSDGKWVTADIPDRALMVFDASEVLHRITKNLSNTTRINLSIDAVVDI